ncbi:MAG: alpha/beta hydrolase [Novosphingobium sp.]|uniref:alpha/beta hydrolase n=1 Tax=Novosphingobium indicum TaxID=462949 RepID=UPI00166DD270|nr:alpha/beta hydrolase [Novosphingobium indicum]
MDRQEEFSLLRCGSAVEAVPGSKITFVIFGGISEGIGIPPFEFRRMMADIPANRIYVRDFAQAWYHAGIDDSAPSLDGAVATIKSMLDSIDTQHTIFVGNSMGGFAALLLGNKLRADKVIAFAPQTYVSPFKRLKTRDFRWMRQITRMYVANGLSKPTYDLRKYLSASSYKPSSDIYYGEASRLDKLHAQNVTDVENVKLHAFSGEGHGLVKELRASGRLEQILMNCVLEAKP